MPKVSIIMNCYNGERYLNEALDSISAQDFSDWEIIFWDNCSTDRSADMAKSFGEKLKYLKSDKLIPLYEARNKALEHCSGEFIAFLDVDDIWEPTKLSSQISKVNDNTPFVFGLYKTIDNKGLVTNQKSPVPKRGMVLNDLLKVNFISIGSVLISKKILCENLFNPSYTLVGDYELWLRLASKYKFDYVDQVVELSRQHEENTSKRLSHKWVHERRSLYSSLFKRLGLRSLFHSNLFLYCLKTEYKNLVN